MVAEGNVGACFMDLFTVWAERDDGVIPWHILKCWSNVHSLFACPYLKHMWYSLKSNNDRFPVNRVKLLSKQDFHVMEVLFSKLFMGPEPKEIAIIGGDFPITCDDCYWLAMGMSLHLLLLGLHPRLLCLHNSPSGSSVGRVMVDHRSLFGPFGGLGSGTSTW